MLEIQSRVLVLSDIVGASRASPDISGVQNLMQFYSDASYFLRLKRSA